VRSNILVVYTTSGVIFGTATIDGRYLKSYITVGRRSLFRRFCLFSWTDGARRTRRISRKLALNRPIGGSAAVCLSGVHLAFHAAMDLDHIVGRVRAEFLEMPGLRLTVQQAARLWGLERALCESVIDILIGSAFLRRSGVNVVARNDA
jgi:hypothetical protein